MAGLAVGLPVNVVEQLPVVSGTLSRTRLELRAPKGGYDRPPTTTTTGPPAVKTPYTTTITIMTCVPIMTSTVVTGDGIFLKPKVELGAMFGVLAIGLLDFFN